MESLGWIVENGFFIKKLLFTSIVKAQHYNEIDLEKIKKYHPFLVKLEPNHQSLVPNGFKPDNWPLIPSKTLVLDLNKININKDIRYEIRKAIKSGLPVRLVQGLPLRNELETFIKLWHKNARDRGFWVPLHKEIKNLAIAFNKNCFLFFANPCHSGESTEGRTTPESIAGALILINGQAAHYMYAFSTPEGRKVSAPYLVMWEIIKFLKNKKLKYLDLEGIYDERYPSSTKNWKGFTKFKMQWGGVVKIYPGSYTKLCFPWSLPFVD